MISGDDIKILDILIEGAISKGCGGTFQAELWQRLKEEHEKLKRLIKLLEDIENEEPGCGECVRVADEKLIAERGKGEKHVWQELRHGYWQYKQDNQNLIIEEYNKLYAEVF